MGGLDVEVEVEGREDAAGVDVTAADQTAETGPDGAVSFDGLPAGEPITVTAALEGAEAEEVVTLEPEERVALSLSLSLSPEELAIASLAIVGPAEIPAGASADALVELEATSAADADYAWSITDPWSIEGEGERARVTAPDEAGSEAEIEVEVSNASGSATESVSATSVACEGDEPRICELHGAAVRHRVSLDTSELNETLSDVPVLLSLPDDVADYDAADPEGADVRIADEGFGELLDHEIGAWSEGDTSSIWARVPEIGSAQDELDLWLYYGIPGAEDGQNESGVWRGDFGAVWHASTAEEDGGSLVLPDSAGGGHDAQSPDGVDWGERFTSGLVGDAIELEGYGSDDEGDPPDTYFEAPAQGELLLEESYTLEAMVAITEDWREFDDVGVDWSVVMSGADDVDRRAYLGIGWREGGVVNCRAQPADAEDEIRNDQPPGDGDVPEDAIVDPDEEGVFTYLACVYDGSDLHSYIDGENVQTVDADPGGPLAAPSDAEEILIGRRLGDRRFGGSLEGVRVSNAPRSDAWFRAQELSLAGELAEIGAAEALE